MNSRPEIAAHAARHPKSPPNLQCEDVSSLHLCRPRWQIFACDSHSAVSIALTLMPPHDHHCGGLLCPGSRSAFQVFLQLLVSFIS